jgi:hypothetical protein
MFFFIVTVSPGHTVGYWLRHCAASQKVAGSRPDEANEYVFSVPNPSGRTKPWSSLSVVTEMSTRKYFWGVELGRCVGLTALPPYTRSYKPTF